MLFKDIKMDRLTPEQRHKNMQAVKNKNSDIEQLLRKELWKRGLHQAFEGHKVGDVIVFRGKKYELLKIF